MAPDGGKTTAASGKTTAARGKTTSLGGKTTGAKEKTTALREKTTESGGVHTEGEGHGDDGRYQTLAVSKTAGEVKEDAREVTAEGESEGAEPQTKQSGGTQIN